MFRRLFTQPTAFKALQHPHAFQQIRAYQKAVANNNPHIGARYNELLNQSSAHPISCNFIRDIVDYWGEASAAQPAIRCVDQDTGERTAISYRTLTQKSHQVSHFFQHHGFKTGDAVALMLGQTPAWWYHLAGLMRAGIAVVPCPRLLTPKDLSYRINDIHMRGIVTTDALQSHIDAIREECPTLTTCLTTGEASQGWLSVNEMPEIADSQVINTTTDTPCLYLYTSGTTGDPKAVQHNADYPFFHWPTGRRWLGATSEDLIYNASDTGWGFTVWITTAAWSMGSELLITPTHKKFEAQRMLATLRDEGVNIFCAAPTVLRLLVADPHFDRTDFPELRRIVTVGEALDETVIQRFKERGVEIAVGFGQAETPLIMGRVDDREHTPGTMGEAIDPYRVVALDDNYHPLPPGNRGQIAIDLVEGSQGGVMRRYANAPEKTKQTRSPDGRYHLTGDWAEYRTDEKFVYLGRRDDLIKSRGYRIGPDEVEKAGMSHPAVAKIAVVGVRTSTESAAFTVKAFILLKPEARQTPALILDIQNHIKRETGPYKHPRLIECLSRHEWEQYETTSGKIRRVGLRERDESKLLHKEAENQTLITPQPLR